MIFATCAEQVKSSDKAKVNRLVSARKSGGRKSQSQHVFDLIATIDSHDYILNVGTLSPENNLLTLVRAWENLNAQHKRGLKLVIVTDGEALSQALKITLQAHIDQGQLIYLSKVTDVEKSFLFSNAKLFVSPGYTDDSGAHLFSAMHYSCPVIVSDIPTHRWVMADAAWYCDPDCDQALAEAMAKLLYKDNAESICESLISRGLSRIKLFMHDKLAKQWIALFQKMKMVQAS